MLSLFIGVISSKNVLAGFYGIIKLLEFSFLAFFVKINFKSFNKTVLFNIILIGIVFESLLAFLQYFNQGSIGGLLYFFGERSFNAQTSGIANASINGQLFLRPYATFSHPNVLAGFLIIAMLYLFLFFKDKTKYLLLGIIMGTGTVLLTLSRTVIVLWATYIFILFGIPLVKKYKNRLSKLKLLIGFSIAFVVIVLIFLIFQNSFILQRIFLTTLTEEAFTQRVALTQQSLAMLIKEPLLGVGINNFFNNLSFVNSRQSIFLIQPVHNIFLLVFSETGLVGFCSFVFLFYASIKKIVMAKKIKIRKYLLMLIFAVIFLGFFDHYFLTIQQGQIMFSIIIGTTLSYGKT